MRIAALLATVLTAALVPALAAVPARAAAHPVAVRQDARPAAALQPLVEVLVERIAIADTVATSKWPTRGPVDDPQREQVVLDAAAAASGPRGIDPADTAAVFRDQIEASKVVQYGLFSAWSADPDAAPTTAPDLAAVRPQLDAITVRILDGLAATRDLRASAGCPTAVHVASTIVEATHSLDRLHRLATDRAVRSLCR